MIGRKGNQAKIPELWLEECWCSHQHEAAKPRSVGVASRLQLEESDDNIQLAFYLRFGELYSHNNSACLFSSNISQSLFYTIHGR